MRSTYIFLIPYMAVLNQVDTAKGLFFIWQNLI